MGQMVFDADQTYVLPQETADTRVWIERMKDSDG